MPESKITQLKDQISAFKGLREKEVVEMFRRATFKNLKAGDILIKKSDDDQMAFVILDGKIKMRMVQDPKENPKTIATFSKGDWIEGMALTADPLQMTSAIAVEPTHVMILDKTTIDSLNEKTQLSVYKRLAHVFTERISQLQKNENNLVIKNIRLREDIFNYRSQLKTDFHHSEMIKGIIKKVPRLPAFVTTLSSQMFTKEIVDQIKRDPALVAIVLKTINSAYYSFQKKISDIHHAVVLLGFEQIYQIVIAEGIRCTMPNTPNFKELHLHSEIVSHIAFMLSLESRNGHPGQMASLGLLHESGQIVLQLLKDQNPKLAAFIDILDQAQLGSLLLKEWNLPDVLWENVEFQSYPEFASPHHVPEELRHNVTLLYLSHLCYDLFQGRKEQELPITFFDEYIALTNWKGLTLNEIALDRLLPALVRKSKAYPLPMRQLIEKQIKT
jgi:HD-like signal output (HDOD) protein/CRP-like cAMP-binding protein